MRILKKLAGMTAIAITIVAVEIGVESVTISFTVNVHHYDVEQCN